MSIILHITGRDQWTAVQTAGAATFAAPSLAEEGFIHCSTPDQVTRVADALFRGQTDLVLLAIDSRKVTPGVHYEDCYDQGERFPHIYGPLNLSAVVAVHHFPANSDGRFTLPPRLQTLPEPGALRLDAGGELRLLELHHAESLFRLTDASRAHLRRWLPWLDQIRSAEDTRRFIREARQQQTTNRGCHFGIWDGDALAGVIGLNQMDMTNRLAAVGYWLGEAFLGQGLVTRAGRRLVDYAFDDLRLNRLELYCAVGNTASCAVARRLGFSHEGVRRQAEWLYDHYVDHNQFGLLAAEWRRPPAAP